MTPAEKVAYVRSAGHIVRYHTADLSRTQSNAEHSFNVVALVLAMEPGASAELLTAALFHDVPEMETGDVPSPTKWRHPALEAQLKTIESEVLSALEYPILTVEQRTVLKWADLLEGAYFCVELFERGDRKARSIAQVFLDAFHKRGGASHARAYSIAEDLLNRLA